MTALKDVICLLIVKDLFALIAVTCWCSERELRI